MKLCKVVGCEKPVNGLGYCAMHYWRVRKYGHPGAVNRLCDAQRRKIQEKTNHALIELPDESVAKISLEDISKCSKYSWYDQGRAVCARINGKIIRLHRYILGEIPASKVVDHINRDYKDNRRENLRIVTQSENCLNSVRSASPTRGVYLDKRDNTYYVRFTIERTNRNFGRFKSKETALQKAKEIISEYGL